MSPLNIQSWFLSNSDNEYLNESRVIEKGKEEISLFKIYSFWGSILPIFIAIGMSILLENSRRIDILYILRLLNNGSLPLVLYSISISVFMFLLDKTNPKYLNLRKKILGLSILLLFLNASLYTFLTALGQQLHLCGQIFILVFTILIGVNVWNTTKTMILLKKRVVKSYFKSFNNIRENIREEGKINKADEIEF
ncbi:hypothetical protein SAMN05660226_02323 [Parapedobacter luteus]|uniref:Uncharacterized protein n=1 Tax=Parapedobacter luteus TaxID=623280 RepID=A0A1T5CTJ3_9SPHI|nr:hypothetical protein [Parapedobacter luteus]SKB62653.1 hypothetical protein SAMN05660226_02323 [Parapedobacter luteus]